MKKDNIKYSVIWIFSIAIFGMILYPLFDLIICKFITNSRFIYSVNEHIIKPIFFGIILGLVLWVVDRKKEN